MADRYSRIVDVCDRLHEANATLDHRSGFCLACADAYVVMNQLTGDDLLALAVERGALVPQMHGKDGERLERANVFIRADT